jgi:hypothetical protein
MSHFAKLQTRFDLRGPNHVLSVPDQPAKVDTDVDGVAKSRRSDAALTTAATASLSPEIADSNFGSPNAGRPPKRDADAYLFDEPTTAADKRRKRRCRGDVITNKDIDDADVDEEACVAPRRRAIERLARIPLPARHHTRQGESLVAGGRQVLRIVSERLTDARLTSEVVAGKGQATRTLWRKAAGLEPELLKTFKAG